MAVQASATSIHDVIEAADVERVSADLSGSAGVTIYRSRYLGKAVLVTRNLPPVANGKVYELWLRDSSRHLHGAGLVTAGGNQSVMLEGGAATATAAGISVEPVGGSSSVTLPVLAMVEFKSA